MMTMMMKMNAYIWMHQIHQMMNSLYIEVDNIMQSIQTWWQVESVELQPMHVSIMRCCQMVKDTKGACVVCKGPFTFYLDSQ